MKKVASKKTVFGAYQIELRLHIFEKLKLPNFFISKPCFSLQIWSFWWVFFWHFEAFPNFHAAPNCKMLYFHRKNHQCLDKSNWGSTFLKNWSWPTFLFQNLAFHCKFEVSNVILLTFWSFSQFPPWPKLHDAIFYKKNPSVFGQTKKKFGVSYQMLAHKLARMLVHMLVQELVGSLVGSKVGSGVGSEVGSKLGS